MEHIFVKQQIVLSESREDIAGSSGTGSNPTKVFTLSTTAAVNIIKVFVSGVLLLETDQYTKDDATKSITMVGTHVQDSQKVSIFYE